MTELTAVPGCTPSSSSLMMELDLYIAWLVEPSIFIFYTLTTLPTSVGALLAAHMLTSAAVGIVQNKETSGSRSFLHRAVGRVSTKCLGEKKKQNVIIFLCLLERLQRPWWCQGFVRALTQEWLTHSIWGHLLQGFSHWVLFWSFVSYSAHALQKQKHRTCQHPRYTAADATYKQPDMLEHSVWVHWKHKMNVFLLLLTGKVGS